MLLPLLATVSSLVASALLYWLAVTLASFLAGLVAAWWLTFRRRLRAARDIEANGIHSPFHSFHHKYNSMTPCLAAIFDDVQDRLLSPHGRQYAEALAALNARYPARITARALICKSVHLVTSRAACVVCGVSYDVPTSPGLTDLCPTCRPYLTLKHA